MEILEVLGIIILVIIGFVVISIGGWLLQVFGWILEFLWEGFEKSLGCLVWVILILLVLGVLIM